MKNIYLGLKFAISYFTVIPVKFNDSDDLSQKQVLASMIFFLPLIGIILSLLTISLYMLLEPLGWVGAVTSGIVYMILYGFLHTEAIIDVVDAIYAKHGGKDPYIVIKEPTVGAVGVLYGVVFTLLKIVAAAYMIYHHMFFEFIAIATASRLMVTFLIYDNKFRSSFIEQLKNSYGIVLLLILFIGYAIIGYLFLGTIFITLLTGVLVFGSLIFIFIKKKLGFANGDVIGFTVECVEIAALLTLSILAA